MKGLVSTIDIRPHIVLVCEIVNTEKTNLFISDRTTDGCNWVTVRHVQPV